MLIFLAFDYNWPKIFNWNLESKNQLNFIPSHLNGENFLQLPSQLNKIIVNESQLWTP